MILPDDSPQQPVVVEINPRLTTSYIGYRQLTGINLLERMLSKNIFTVPIPWDNHEVTWNVQEL
jgi:predicted ATP-grasp superfamily ATP-dependent carboligase